MRETILQIKVFPDTVRRIGGSMGRRQHGGQHNFISHHKHQIRTGLAGVSTGTTYHVTQVILEPPTQYGST